jgi:hypothetical protein
VYVLCLLLVANISLAQQDEGGEGVVDIEEIVSGDDLEPEDEVRMRTLFVHARRDVARTLMKRSMDIF